MKIRYTKNAINDLARLKEFIESKNPSAASRFANELHTAMEKLKVFPSMGLVVKKAPDPTLIRDLFINNYTIRYLLVSDVIFVLRVWHNKENEKDTMS
jgi:plasmid stabilization system protein ParE